VRGPRGPRNGARQSHASLQCRCTPCPHSTGARSQATTRPTTRSSRIGPELEEDAGMPGHASPHGDMGGLRRPVQTRRSTAQTTKEHRQTTKEHRAAAAPRLVARAASPAARALAPLLPPAHAPASAQYCQIGLVHARADVRLARADVRTVARVCCGLCIACARARERERAQREGGREGGRGRERERETCTHKHTLACKSFRTRWSLV